MKLLAATLLAAVLAGSPAAATAPDRVQLVIVPLAWDDKTVTLWWGDVNLLIQLASKDCEVY